MSEDTTEQVDSKHLNYDRDRLLISIAEALVVLFAENELPEISIRLDAHAKVFKQRLETTYP